MMNDRRVACLIQIKTRVTLDEGCAPLKRRAGI
jgi:hypothetical protein